MTSPGSTIGTVAYMSPEQVRAQELDARTDLFAFGAVLYEMATGKMAFAGSSSGVIFEAILNRMPAPVSSLNPLIPTKLDELITKSLEKDRDLRYQTAAELRGDLKRTKRDLDTSRVRANSGSVPVASPSGISGSSAISEMQAVPTAVPTVKRSWLPLLAVAAISLLVGLAGGSSCWSVPPSLLSLPTIRSPSAVALCSPRVLPRTARPSFTARPGRASLSTSIPLGPKVRSRRRWNRKAPRFWPSPPPAKCCCAGQSSARRIPLFRHVGPGSVGRRCPPRNSGECGMGRLVARWKFPGGGSRGQRPEASGVSAGQSNLRGRWMDR